MASPARIRTRHRGIAGSFVLLVLAPALVTIWYLFAVARDQYASVTGFTVRQEETGTANLLGGLAQFAGGAANKDSDVLYQFIKSQDLVRAVDARLDLAGHYASVHEADPVFALKPEASIEELVAYWRRAVRVSYDQATGLIELRVLAFDPGFARDVGRAVVLASQERVNALNRAARDDAMRYARADLDAAVDQLKASREALTVFRTRTRIVDPATDMEARFGVMNNLQQQLAMALVEHDVLRQTSRETDPRVIQAGQRIDVIRNRIAEERRTFASDTTETGAVGEDYPTLIAEYERLVVDSEVAEERYRAALAALELARANADRQSRYLATYIQPTLAETAEHPQRILIGALVALALCIGWAILVMIAYSIRDRR